MPWRAHRSPGTHTLCQKCPAWTPARPRFERNRNVRAAGGTGRVLSLGQHLLSASARVDEVPARRQLWMRALFAPQQNTLGSMVHDGGQRLQSQVGLIPQHAGHDEVTSALRHRLNPSTPCQSRPLLRASTAFQVRAWYKGVKVTRWH